MLRSHQLYVKMPKCVFGQTQVEYLGHFVSAGGVYADPSKIAAIQDWPQPTKLKELRSFLGLAGYYCKFIHNYGCIVAPLIELLKKEAFR